MAILQPYFVRDDLIGLRILDGDIVAGALETYVPEPGDSIFERNGAIRRDGDYYGVLVKRDGQADLVHRADSFAADPARAFLTEGAADLPSSFSLTIDGVEQSPAAVWRKTKIVETAQADRWTREFVLEHDIVLELSGAAVRGSAIEIAFADPSLAPVSFVFDDLTLPSEAVHVSQTGFEPDDPVKIGYLSTWLGGQAADASADPAVRYQLGQTFHVRDAATGQSVFAGEVALDKGRDQPSNYKVNFNGTDVYALDFSAFDEPGRYVLQIDGIGRSLPFEIKENAWEEPFALAMNGLYNQRSGVPLDADYGGMDRPRSLHPDDGFVIRQSTATLMDTSMGLNLLRQDSFEALAAGATSEIVPNAFGGWHDAGDWDRRAQHLRAARDLLELAEKRPEFAVYKDLSIPEQGDGIPDLIDQALWGVDFFQRLQKPDGGVPGGIEAAGHPKGFETSWTESQELFVFAPDAWSSYEFAATAARAVSVLASYDAPRAADYLASAEAAMAWAEANRPPHADASKEVNTSRNLAAAELYKATGEASYHDLFLATTSYAENPAASGRQFEAVMVYNDIHKQGLAIDPSVLDRARADLTGHADFLVSTGDRGAFGQVIDPGRLQGWSYVSTLPADAAATLVKAHMLTADHDYFDAIIGDTQFGLGANPDNMVFTLGLGERHPREVLNVDGIGLGVLPEGITIFGLWNIADRGSWPGFSEIDTVTFPTFTTPVPYHETYNSNQPVAILTEYSLHAAIAPTAYVWGYLAATDRNGAAAFPVAPSADDDFADNASTSGRIEVPGTLQGSIEVADDRDWLALDLTAGQTYDIDIIGHSDQPLQLPQARLLGPDGSQLAADGNSAGDAVVRIRHTAEASATHYLEVAATGDDATGGYQLRVRPLLAEDFSGGPDTSAVVRPDDGPAIGRIEHPNDNDWLAVDLVAGRSYQIDVGGFGVEPLLDPFVRLRAPDGSTLRADINSGNGQDARIVHSAAESGRYFVQVHEAGRDATGDYAVKVDTLAATKPAQTGATIDSPPAVTRTASAVDRPTEEPDLELPLGVDYGALIGSIVAEPQLSFTVA